MQDQGERHVDRADLEGGGQRRDDGGKQRNIRHFSFDYMIFDLASDKI